MIPFDPARIEALNQFIEERERIRVKKESGESRPWTQDPIFQQWKFCNVEREKDRGTRWVAQNWREPHADDPHLWFALVIARRALNWPPAMEELGYPIPWNPGQFVACMNRREQRGLKCYDTAYQLLVQGQKGNKAEMLVKHILNPLWEARNEVAPCAGDTLRSFYERLSQFKYMGTFYSGQVIADLKYAQLKNASDWWTFAVPGPGSERGLNRILGRDKATRWKEKDWYDTLVALNTNITMKIDLSNTQNCLCEFDKYERIKYKEGKVRPYKSNDCVYSVNRRINNKVYVGQHVGDRVEMAPSTLCTEMAISNSE